MNFNKDELKLIEFAKDKIKKYGQMRKNNWLYDIIFAFVLSENNDIYEWIPLELPSGIGFCAERHAIANMVLKETEKVKIKAVLIAGPVPENNDKLYYTPCGACRLAIYEFWGKDTIILSMNYIRTDTWWNRWTIWKFKLQELYPYPWSNPWED